MTAASGPPFARDFPSDPELTALVRAFEAGDFAHVRREAPKLAARKDDAAIKDATALLVARTEADPLARGLLALTLVLLLGLTAFWLAHDSPKPTAPAPPPQPTVERVDEGPRR